MKKLKYILTAPIVFVLMVLASCQYVTPTVVPPLTDELGYDVPNISGVTTTGVLKGAYAIEHEKLRLWGFSVDLTLEATEAIRAGAVELMAVLGIGGVAALPAALNRVPKGAIKKEDAVRLVNEAGNKDSREFEAVDVVDIV